MNKNFIQGGYSNTGSGGGGGGGGSGTGTVTSVSSPSGTINVANPTTTPQIDVNTGTNAGQIVQLQNTAGKGVTYPVAYSGLTMVNNTINNPAGVVASIDDTVSSIGTKLGQVVQNLNGKTGSVSLTQGTSITITPTGNNIQIASTAVTNVSSPSGTIIVANGSSTPQIDVNTGTNVGQIVQVQSNNGGSLPSIYSGNTKVTNPVDSTNSSLDNVLSNLNTKIPANVVQSLNSLNGNVSLTAGSNITLTSSGQNIQIAATTTSQNTIPIVAVWDYNKQNISMTYSYPTFTASANGTLPNIDQVTLTTGSRFALINYTNSALNGIYTVNSMGSASTKFSITRATDFNSITNVKTGALYAVKAGNGLYAGSTLTLNTAITTLDTSPIYFSILVPNYMTPSNIISPVIDNKYLSPNQDVTNLANGSVNNTKFQYLSNVSSDIQAQLDGKLTIISGTIPTGSLLYKAASGWQILPQGNSGQYLLSNGSNNPPVWGDGTESVVTFSWTPVDAGQLVAYDNAVGDGILIGRKVFLRFTVYYGGQAPSPDYNAQINGWDSTINIGNIFTTGCGTTTANSLSTIMNQVRGGNDRLNLAYNGRITTISQLVNTQVTGQIEYIITETQRKNFMAKVAAGQIPLI